MNTGTKLRMQMARVRMTQVEMSQLTGYSKSSISRWQKGEALPDALAIVKMARALEIDPAELLPDLEEEEERATC